MENFTFYAPTYFAFGKDAENETGKYVKRFGGSRVLIHYGGGSVIRTGLLDRVKKSLDAENITYVELGGVKPNPRSGLVYEELSFAEKKRLILYWQSEEEVLLIRQRRLQQVQFMMAISGISIVVNW